MKRNLFVLVIWFLLSLGAYAHIDVVYPASKNLTVYTPSIFFIGNTTAGANLKINSNHVKLWDNNFFVQVVPLKYGKNTIRIVSQKNRKREEKIFTITRQKTAEVLSQERYQPKKFGYTYKTETIKDNAVIREIPSVSAGRIIEMPKNIVLYIAGKQGDFYEIEEKGNTRYWIHSSNVKEPVQIKYRTPAVIKSIKKLEDKNYDYIKFSLNYPVLYNLEQEDNKVKITLFGIKTPDSENYIYTYAKNGILTGYDAYYENNTLVFRSAKTPKVKNTLKPLKDITVFVDPGHGGSEKGSVGPTRVCEKDVNLAISRYLAKYLNDEGANVIVSRSTDKTTALYDRVKMAKASNAVISISIHNNALPNGKDPYKKHGTEVHYYNENAKLLAQTIQQDMVQSLYFNDNGIHKSSFALTRSTNPVSVLVECAYMINPEEYIRLRNDIVQKQIAKSIKNSLKKYIIAIQE